MSRLVLDATVLLAALAGRPQASPALLLAGVHNGDLEAVARPTLLAEVRAGLRKPYFRARLTDLESREALDAYAELAVISADPLYPEAVLRDPADDYLVALARTAEADAIVTGERAGRGTPSAATPRWLRLTRTRLRRNTYRGTTTDATVGMPAAGSRP